MKSKLRWLVAMIAALAIVAVADPETLVGKDAPDIKLKTLDGKDFDLDKVEGKLIILDFWASWCPPCRAGLPDLQKFSDWVKAEDLDEDVKIFAINCREDEATIKKAWEELKVSLPVVMDTNGAALEAYKVEGIPTTIAVSGGKVVHAHVGYSQDGLDMYKKWAEEYAK